MIPCSRCGTPDDPDAYPVGRHTCYACLAAQAATRRAAHRDASLSRSDRVRLARGWQYDPVTATWSRPCPCCGLILPLEAYYASQSYSGACISCRRSRRHIH